MAWVRKEHIGFAINRETDQASKTFTMVSPERRATQGSFRPASWGCHAPKRVGIIGRHPPRKFQTYPDALSRVRVGDSDSRVLEVHIVFQSKGDPQTKMFVPTITCLATMETACRRHAHKTPSAHPTAENCAANNRRVHGHTNTVQLYDCFPKLNWWSRPRSNTKGLSPTRSDNATCPSATFTGVRSTRTTGRERFHTILNASQPVPL